MNEQLYNAEEIRKKAEVFLDDKVIARNLVDEKGRDCSLGYVLPGEFDVTVEASETVEVLGGQFEIDLMDGRGMRSFQTGEIFYVPENGSYHLTVSSYFDYFCTFGL